MAQDFPGYPVSFWGEAEVDGGPISEGEEIKALCEGEIIGEVNLKEDGVYGYQEPIKQKLLVSACDSDIVFQYKELEIRTDGNSFKPGDVVNKNLEFEKEESGTPPSSSPPSRGGGGRTRPRTEPEDDAEEDADSDQGEVLGEDDIRLLDLNQINNQLQNKKEEREKLTRRVSLIEKILPNVQKEEVHVALSNYLEKAKKMKEEKRSEIEKLEMAAKIREEVNELEDKKNSTVRVINLFDNLKEEREDVPDIWKVFTEKLESRKKDLNDKLTEKREVLESHLIDL